MSDPAPKFDIPTPKPSEEEKIARAEGMMTEEEKKLSEAREKEVHALQAEAERREGVPIEFVYRSMRETPETEKNLYEYARLEDDLGIILSEEQKRAFESFPREWVEALNQDDPHEPGKKHKETYGVFPMLDKAKLSLELRMFLEKKRDEEMEEFKKRKMSEEKPESGERQMRERFSLLDHEIFPLSLRNMHKLLEARRAQLEDELNKAKEDKAKDREEEVQEKLTRLPRFYPGSASWFTNESQEFAQDAPVSPRWAMVRKEPLPGSPSKDLAHQLALLAKVSEAEVEARITRPLREIRERWQRQEISLAVRRSQEEAFLAELLKESDYEIPVGREEAEQKILYHLKTGERLNENIWARCRDLGADGYRVFVGRFESGGLNVLSGWDGSASSALGLALSRKFRK